MAEYAFTVMPLNGMAGKLKRLEREVKHNLEQWVDHNCTRDIMPYPYDYDYVLSASKLQVVEAFAHFFSLQWHIDPKWINPYAVLLDMLKEHGNLIIHWHQELEGGVLSNPGIIYKGFPESEAT